MRFHYIFLLVFVSLFLRADPTLVVDNDASMELENLIENDDLVFSIHNIKPQQLAGKPETLMVIEFDQANDQRFTMLLDRQQKKVIIETIEDDNPFSQQFPIGSIDENFTIKSLILAMHQGKPDAVMKLFVDCIKYGHALMFKTLRDMYLETQVPQVRLLSPMKQPVDVEGTDGLNIILSRHNCPVEVEVYQKSLFSSNTKVNHPEPRRKNPSPIVNINTDATRKSLDEMIERVNKLSQDVHASKMVGNDPSQMSGSQEMLSRGCKSQCGKSSTSNCGMQSSGCRLNPCPPGLKFVSTEFPPCYICVACPLGYTGKGTFCVDLDECEVAQPCFPKAICRNLRPGYSCGPCPRGYTGSSVVEGVGIVDAQRKKQECYDINECAKDNGGCVPNSVCTNTIGSYICGSCARGYEGNQTVGCTWIEGFCIDNSFCDANALCELSVAVQDMRCKCNRGWAGNGDICVTDTDLDGWPDIKLDCKHPRCKKDNCPSVANPNQEDMDGDDIGDVCDPDVDGDGILNERDNCKLVYNPKQEDSDGDGIGNVCDNCPNAKNPNQEDTDGDGIGDACDDDIDNDTFVNTKDNCKYIPNPHQIDTDGDGIGDVCDNCPDTYNPDQVDINENLIGDACDPHLDQDSDGIPDFLDNCPDVINSDQLDTDGDGVGDECDDDIDGDGVPNHIDNCYLIPNPLQEDTDHTGIGDVCKYDWDRDGIPKELDNCPNNSRIHKANFTWFETVELSPYTTAQGVAKWVIENNGTAIRQLVNNDPALAVGRQSFSSLDFEGTLLVDTKMDEDIVGFVFGYQSNHRFYVVTWKHQTEEYWITEPFRAEAHKGVELKLVRSDKGVGPWLRNALWHSGDKMGIVKVLWRDLKYKPWMHQTPYRWIVSHRPKMGLIRFRIFEGTRTLIDSGNVIDLTLKGGRIGVYCFSQENVVWSNLTYRCNEELPDDITHIN